MENLSGGQGFLLLHQHLRRMDWSKITPGVTQPEYLILTALHVQGEKNPDGPGVYVSSLAEELSVSVSMISKLLKSMEEKDWILRTIDKNSRRPLSPWLPPAQPSMKPPPNSCGSSTRAWWLPLAGSSSPSCFPAP